MTNYGTGVRAPFAYLNGKGSNGYNIFRAEPATGLLNPLTPLIGPQAGNAGTNITQVAWPSAFQLEGKVRVYAARQTVSGVQDISYWEATDGVTFGSATVAISGAANGYSVFVVFVVPGDSRPWKMLVPDRAVDGKVLTTRLYTSVLGTTSWRDDGVVLTATETWETGIGVTPSHVERASNGEWVLFYHAYESSLIAHSAVATTTDLAKGFTKKQKILSPFTGQSGTITAAAASRANTITTALTVNIGEPYAMWQSGMTVPEFVTPVKQSGTTVWLSAPLVQAFNSGATLAHIGAAKVDPQMAWESYEGWRCVFTGYGAISGVLVEGTFLGSASRLRETWTVEPVGLVFKPGPADTLNSLENPCPLVDARGVA